MKIENEKFKDNRKIMLETKTFKKYEPEDAWEVILPMIVTSLKYYL